MSSFGRRKRRHISTTGTPPALEGRHPHLHRNDLFACRQCRRGEHAGPPAAPRCCGTIDDLRVLTRLAP